ncbi:DMT family transporter [Dinoroseobacter sp. S375]|uniref:DMT family transporter n=1 Tax=Dinoroseobacter sp. S375 TaxID=3415136 RepID=UPI003C7A3F92
MVLQTGLLFVLGLLWSLRLSAIKAAGMSGIPVHVVVTLSALGIALFFTGVALLRRDWPPLDRGTLGFYGLSGLLGFLAPLVLETAVGPHLPVFVFVVIIATMPLFTFGLAALVGRERMRAGPLMAIALGFVGAVAILWDVSRGSSVGATRGGWILAAFGVPLLYALNTVFVATRWPRHASPVNVAQAQALIVALAALMGSVAAGTTGAWTLAGLNAPALLLIVIGEGLALVVYLRITRDYGATYVSFANYASIGFAAVFGAVWFGDHLSGLTGLAALAIIGSIILYQRQTRGPDSSDRPVAERGRSDG